MIQQTLKIAFSVEEASLYSNIGKTRLYQAMNSGALKSKKMGRKTLILRSDLESFLSNLDNYSTNKKEG